MNQKKNFIASTSETTRILRVAAFCFIVTFLACSVGMLTLFLIDATQSGQVSNMPLLKRMTSDFLEIFGFAGLLLIGSSMLRAASPLDEEDIEDCLIHEWGRDAKLLLLNQFKKNQTIRMHHVLHALHLQEKMAKRMIKENKAMELQRQKERQEARLKKWEIELSKSPPSTSL